MVKPGITGLAQVNPEPNGIKSWSKSIKLDIYYVNNISFILICKFFKNIKVNIKQKKTI